MGAQRSEYNLSEKTGLFHCLFPSLNLGLMPQILGFVHISLILDQCKIFYFYFHRRVD